MKFIQHLHVILFKKQTTKTTWKEKRLWCFWYLVQVKNEEETDFTDSLVLLHLCTEWISACQDWWQQHDWQECLKKGVIIKVMDAWLLYGNSLLHADVLSLQESVDHKNNRRGWNCTNTQLSPLSESNLFFNHECFCCLCVLKNEKEFLLLHLLSFVPALTPEVHQ